MRHFCMIMTTAVVLCACGHRAPQAEGKDSTDSTATVVSQDSLMTVVGSVVTVDTVQFEKNDSTAEVYPSFPHA